MRTHKERVTQVKGFVGKNKLFTVTAIAAVVLLCGNFVFTKADIAETSEASSQSETEDMPEWQFYPLDFWILLIGGGFCTVMIIRERKKAKEELQ